MTLKIDPMHCKGSIRSNTRSEKRRCSCEIRFINSKLIEERMFLPQGPIMSQGHCWSLRCMRNFLRWPWLAKQKTNKKSGYQRMETTIAGNGFAKDHTLETLKGTKLFSGTFPYHKPFCSFLWFQFFNGSTTKTAMRTKERRKNNPQNRRNNTTAMKKIRSLHKSMVPTALMPLHKSNLFFSGFLHHEHAVQMIIAKNHVKRWNWSSSPKRTKYLQSKPKNTESKHITHKHATEIHPNNPTKPNMPDRHFLPWGHIREKVDTDFCFCLSGCGGSRGYWQSNKPKTGHEKVDREKKGAKVMWTAHLIGYTAFLFSFLISCRNTICFSSTSYPQLQLSLE